MKKPSFLPFRDKALIRPSQEEDSPIKVSDSERAKPDQGVIVAIGSGMITENGAIIPPTHIEGDHVYFGKYAGTDIELDGETFRIMSEAEILGMRPRTTSRIDG